MINQVTETEKNNNKTFSSEVGSHKGTVILGGGLAGLSAGYVLSKAGRKVTVYEKDSRVGGLSKTYVQNGFRFDLGGHRFLTHSKKLEDFALEVLKNDVITVPRTSQIYMFNKYFDYPLKAANAMFGLGIFTTFLIMLDYIREKIKNKIREPEIISLEDWVVSRFGRKMFNLYFKQYSEKVWGIDCSQISQEWVAKRIEGLSLWKAVKSAFKRVSGKEIKTLADEFLYPPLGIGVLSDNMKDEIEAIGNSVQTGVGVVRINHENFQIKSITVKDKDKTYDVEAEKFITSIPFTHTAKLLHPAVPDDIMKAASSLNYRDIAIVTIMLDREQVTNLTWLYLPEKDMPLGRIHEPKNWSKKMSPEGKTSIVTEFFCFKGDKIWNSSDKELTNITVKHLEELGFIKKSDVIDSSVIREDKAYPLMEVGFREHYEKVLNYLDKFKNLHVIGRGGMFQYHNMDAAMETGIEAAEAILGEER